MDVHELLQTEFRLEDGLASTVTWGEMAEGHKDLKIPDGVDPEQPFVQILDPATGTATFLVQVIDTIHNTMVEQWKSQGRKPPEIANLWNEYVPRHLLPRLYGYELMMAPYAIAHMKIGLKLAETGYDFGSVERVRVYLTNALEPAAEVDRQFNLLEELAPALAHEAQAVNEIKRRRRFTVVVGNPPYSGISSNMTEQVQQLVDAYKTVDGEALNERKLWLQDDYVKFVRLAQLTIEHACVGVLGYITNHGYLDNPTFRGMRQSLIRTFSHLRVLDLHGNANKKEQSPDGSDDQNVFDIRQGVAICLAILGSTEATVQHTELWGMREGKYERLAKFHVSDTGFSRVSPNSPFYLFVPQNIDTRAEYDQGWRISEAMPVNSAGFITARDHFVTDFDSDALLNRIADFANPKLSDAEIRSKYFAGCGSEKYPEGDTRGWKVSAARKRVQSDKSWRDRVLRCLYRPFDFRFVYWVDWMVDWPRPEVMSQMLWENNRALLTARSNKTSGTDHFFCSSIISETKCAEYSTQSAVFPLYRFQRVYTAQGGLALGVDRQPNFAPGFLRELTAVLGIPQIKPHGLPRGLAPEDIFYYAYAVFYSPGYRRRYAEFLKFDFPRVPLPRGLDLFLVLTSLGGELGTLHLMESPKLNDFVTTYTGPRDPEVKKVGWSDDTVWLDAAATKKNQPARPGTIGFHGVPEDVWNFHIGGYQVCHKWLKDRKGRTLSDEDIAHYQKIVVALHETIRIMKEIDEVIEEHGGWPGAFVGSHD